MSNSSLAHYLSRAVARGVRAWLLGSLAWLALAAGAAGLLKKLPYSSCLLETAAAGTSEPFGNRAADLSWYRVAPTLEPFRQLFGKSCRGAEGVAAAICVNDVFAERFPFGRALLDFCDRRYVPAADLARHLAGSPGHCMQRSALLAATLLSVGLRARVVQFMYEGGAGHSLVEIWDAGRGWMLLDPSSGSLVGTDLGPCSASTLLRTAKRVRVWPGGKASLWEAAPGSLYKGIDGSLLQGHVIYPEPWLYMRTGQRYSSWPFRGRYSVAGTPDWRFGAGQRSCQMALLVCAGLSLACAGNAWGVARGARHRRVMHAGPAPGSPAGLRDLLCAASPKS